MSNDNMTLVEHLAELRKRIIWVLIVFVLSMGIGLAFADPVINLIKDAHFPKDQVLNALSPWDGIRTYMQFAVAIGLVLSLPFILYQIWAFVRPGLRPREQRAALQYIPFAVLLYLIGLAFGYFVIFPMALYFTGLMASRLQLQLTYGITQYFTFMFNLLLPISVLFEMPIIVLFLTKLRILNPMRLQRLRRYAYVVLLVVSAIITPPDVVSAVLVSIPLISLYEISVWLSRITFRRQMEADRRREAEFDREYA